MRQEAKDRLVEVLAQAFDPFRSLSSIDLPSAPGSEGDLIVELEIRGKSVLLGAMLSRRAGAERLIGTFARLALELQARRQEDTILVPVVVDEQAGDAILGRIESFARRCLPELGFGMVGAARRRLEIPELDISVTDRTKRPSVSRDSARGKRSRLFTDTDRWLLKLFLLRELRDAKHLKVADQSVWPPVDAKALSTTAGVAYETARSFCEAYVERGFLIRTPGPVRLKNVPALLDSWIENERGWRRDQVFARSLDGRPIDLAVDTSLEYAIGGFEAARFHGLKHAVNAEPLMLHIRDDHDHALVSWGLVSCEETQAQVRLVRPAHATSVFSAVSMSPEGKAVVDRWQAALDVAPLRRRGHEQAQFIRDSIALEHRT